MILGMLWMVSKNLIVLLLRLVGKKDKHFTKNGALLYKWAPTSYKQGYNPINGLIDYKWSTGVITLLVGVITASTTGRG